MAKKASPKPPIVWKEFVLFWWAEAPGNRMEIYRTRQPGDIEVFSRNHYRIHFRPDSTEDDNHEVIIRHHNGLWMIKVDEDEEFSAFFDQDDENALWTWMDDLSHQLFVIRGVEKIGD